MFLPIRRGIPVDVSQGNGGFAMTLQTLRHKGTGIAAIAGLGALIAGCSAQTGQTMQAAPMALACEPNQRAVVRQVIVNGAPQAQLECSSMAPAAAMPGALPVNYAPAALPVNYGYTQAALPETQFVPAVYSAPVAREVAPRSVAQPQRVAYQPARERVAVSHPKRSVKKSAVIIGSSAGVGAGIGAAFGGKKGAGIGALVGGGGAALWDQLTRRK
jgi:hypothetical protein